MSCLIKKYNTISPTSRQCDIPCSRRNEEIVFRSAAHRRELVVSLLLLWLLHRALHCARNAAARRDATALLLQRRFMEEEVYVSEAGYFSRVVDDGDPLGKLETLR